MPNNPFLNCPSCGKNISDNDPTCPHCGLDLDAPLTTAELQAQAQPYLDKAKKSLENGFNLGGALSNCDTALEFVPESAEAHNLRGLILDSLHQGNDAILAYREAIRLDPNFTEARKNLDDAEKEYFNFNTGETPIEQQGNHQPGLRPLNILITVLAVGICLSALIGLTVIAYTFGRPLLMLNQDIIYEPDTSLMKTVSTEDLQKTAQILQQRWAALGYNGIQFAVTDEGKIIGQVPADVSATLIQRTKAFGLVEFVDAGETRFVEGTTINTDFPSPYFPSALGEKWHTIMTNAEISTATVNQNGSQYEIAFTLTEKGRKIMADFSRTHVGSILAILMDKSVVSAPTISAEIPNGEVVITGQFTKEEADDLKAKLRTAPLPIPLK